MASLIEAHEFPAQVLLLEKEAGHIFRAGKEGVVNTPMKQLADRTRFLLTQMGVHHDADNGLHTIADLKLALFKQLKNDAIKEDADITEYAIKFDFIGEVRPWGRGKYSNTSQLVDDLLFAEQLNAVADLVVSITSKELIAEYRNRVLGGSGEIYGGINNVNGWDVVGEPALKQKAGICCKTVEPVPHTDEYKSYINSVQLKGVITKFINGESLKILTPTDLVFPEADTLEESLASGMGVKTQRQDMCYVKFKIVNISDGTSLTYPNGWVSSPNGYLWEDIPFTQQHYILSNIDNNIFMGVDFGFYQTQYEIITTKHAATMEECFFTQVPEEELGENLYINGEGYYAIPMFSLKRYNRGAYHPMANPFGAAKFHGVSPIVHVAHGDFLPTPAPRFSIKGVNLTNQNFLVAGDQRDSFREGSRVQVTETAGSNGYYTVNAATHVGDYTFINTLESIAADTKDTGIIESKDWYFTKQCFETIAQGTGSFLAGSVSSEISGRDVREYYDIVYAHQVVDQRVFLNPTGEGAYILAKPVVSGWSKGIYSEMFTINLVIENYYELYSYDIQVDVGHIEILPLTSSKFSWVLPEVPVGAPDIHAELSIRAFDEYSSYSDTYYQRIKIQDVKVIADEAIVYEDKSLQDYPHGQAGQGFVYTDSEGQKEGEQNWGAAQAAWKVQSFAFGLDVEQCSTTKLVLGAEQQGTFKVGDLIATDKGSTIIETVSESLVALDFDSSNWSSLFSSVLPEAVSCSQCVSIGSVSYLLGGTIDGAPTRNIYKASAGGSLLGSWNLAGTLPIAISGGICITTDRFVYLIGGSTKTKILSAAIINGSIQEWTLEEEELPMDMEGGSALVINNVLHLFGSELYPYTTNIVDGILGSVWLAAPEPMMEILTDSRCLQLEGMVYLLGGTLNGSITNHVYKSPIQVDGSLGRWVHQVDDNLKQKLRGAAYAVVCGKIYLIGGETDAGLSQYVYIANKVGDRLNWDYKPIQEYIPLPLKDSQLFAIGKKMFLLGGENDSGGSSTIYEALFNAPLAYPSKSNLGSASNTWVQVDNVVQYICTFSSNPLSGVPSQVYKSPEALYLGRGLFEESFNVTYLSLEGYSQTLTAVKGVGAADLIVEGDTIIVNGTPRIAKTVATTTLSFGQEVYTVEVDPLAEKAWEVCVAPNYTEVEVDSVTYKENNTFIVSSKIIGLVKDYNIKRLATGISLRRNEYGQATISTWEVQ